MWKPGRGISWIMGLVLGLGLFAAPAAYAVQASGSLLVTPTDWGLLTNNQVIDVKITGRNTSTDTPAADFPGDTTNPVGATLTGDITVKLACTLPCCTAQAPGRLQFVPVGGSGCVVKNAAVTGCALSGPDTVTLTLAGPIALPADGAVDVATIRVKVLDANSSPGQLGIQAFTQCASVNACSTSAPAVCAQCEADGCTKLVFTQSTITGCPHPCPAKIIFRGTTSNPKPDSFEFHAIITVSNSFDPPNQPFTVSLSNANFNPIFSFTLPPGNITGNGNVFVYNKVSASSTGGIRSLKFGLRDGTTNDYRIDIHAYADMETKATLPLMTTDFSIGSDSFSLTAAWAQVPYGWTFDP